MEKSYQKLQPCISCRRGCCGQPCNPFSERLPTAQISTQGIALRGAPVRAMLEQCANLNRLSKILPVTNRQRRENTSILHKSDPLRYLRQESRIWANSWTRRLHRSQRSCKSNQGLGQSNTMYRSQGLPFMQRKITISSFVINYLLKKLYSSSLDFKSLDENEGYHKEVKIKE